MLQSTIINTDIKVSRIAFGTGSLHHLFSSKKRQKLLQVASTEGITHFDTSPYYGYGLAEADLGLLLFKKREKFTVATKVGLYPRYFASSHASSVWVRKGMGKIYPNIALPYINWQIEYARMSLRKSLKRLKTDYVDFLFLHEPNSAFIQTDEFSRWIESEKTQGTIRSWGLAGLAKHIKPCLLVPEKFIQIIQTKDSLERKEADFLLENQHPFQFTYGYFSSCLEFAEEADKEPPELIIRRALKRTNQGVIIISTRKPERIKQLTHGL